MSARGAYKRRKRNAAFREAWQTCVRSAYQRLELVLLERFFHGTEKIVTRNDGSIDRMREFPNQLGLSLLKLHRSTMIEAETAAEMTEEEVEALRERVLEKVRRLEQRRDRDAA